VPFDEVEQPMDMSDLPPPPDDSESV